MKTARKRPATRSRTLTEHHRLLGVPPDATQADVKRAYRHLALEVQPDANPDDPAAAEQFRRLTEAYDTLRSWGIPELPSAWKRRA
jgi:molecular chaperone DnaJ